MKKSNRYISVSGVMGSGKTTLCNLLSKELGIPVIEENFKENIFLPLYYEDPKSWALHSQLFCLKEKAAQLMRLKNMVAKSSVIQDTPIYQDVFAYAEAQKVLGYMSDREYELYHQFYKSYLKEIPEPHLIVQLEVSVPTLSERIKKRGRPFEKSIGAEYLALLAKLQKKWIKKHSRIPVITVKNDGGKYDILNDAEYRGRIIKQIKKALG